MPKKGRPLVVKADLSFHILDLSPYFNNRGIAADRPKGPDADLDGCGAAYRVDSLPEPNSVIPLNGVRFLFPGIGHPSGDNLVPMGQCLSVPANRYIELHVLGASEWGSFEEEILLRYEDGSGESALLGLTDSLSETGPLFGEKTGIRCKVGIPDEFIPLLFYLGLDQTSEHTKELELDGTLWHQVVALDPHKILTSIRLPDNPSMHLFALTLQLAEHPN